MIYPTFCGEKKIHPFLHPFLHLTLFIGDDSKAELPLELGKRPSHPGSLPWTPCFRGPHISQMQQYTY